jgi:hypothetical protein
MQLPTRFLYFFSFVLVFNFLLAARCFADNAIVINEVLVHPSSGNKEWVEFYTPGTDLTNYWVDDDTDFNSDSGSSPKKQMTALVAGADAHHVVYELDSSMFNNDGDTVALFSPDGKLVDSYQYTSDPGEDITIGRTPDVTGAFALLANATRGSANASAMPTATLTPEPTDKPTKEPASPTSSSSVTDDTYPTMDMTSPLPSEMAFNTSFSPSSTATMDALPTSILNTTQPASNIKPTPKVLVKGASISTTPFIMTGFGGLFFLACGILIYLKKKGIWQ